MFIILLYVFQCYLYLRRYYFIEIIIFHKELGIPNVFYNLCICTFF